MSQRLHAAVFRSPGEPLTIEELEVEPPHAGEVLVRLAASGVCHSDYHVVLGEWSAPTPLVLGHEGAGTVVDVGEGVTRVRPGDHVVLSWSPSCGHCRYCTRGRVNLCEVAAATTYGSVAFDGTTRLRRGSEDVFNYLGVGSFGELAVVAESAAIRIREDAPLDKAAIVGCAVTTGIGAVINTARVEPGASVLVIGCGGVGLSVVMGARLAGASPIIAADVVESKLALARAVGATETIDARSVDVVDAARELTDGQGVEYAFEAIGLPRAIEQAYEAVAPGGTAVVVGQVPEGERISIDPFVMSDREKVLMGSNYGSARPMVDFARIIDLDLAGRIDLGKLISAHVGLDGVNDAFAAMARGETARTIIRYA